MSAPRTNPGLPLRAALWIGIGVSVLASAFATSVSRTDFILHHVPTAACLAWLVFWRHRHPFDALAHVLLAVFLLIHIVGAHYLYSEVPYDAWIRGLLGFEPTERFGWQRNHYDRFVHFSFGLLVLRVAHQLVAQHATASRAVLLTLAILVITGCGAFYELLEWGIAVNLAPETAANYNGQQGDIWDAQQDQAIAILGALLAIPLEVLLPSRKGAV